MNQGKEVIDERGERQGGQTQVPIGGRRSDPLRSYSAGECVARPGAFLEGRGLKVSRPALKLGAVVFPSPRRWGIGVAARQAERGRLESQIHRV